MPNHEEQDRQSLLFHTAAIKMIQADPALIDRALSILDRWEGTQPHPSFVEWRRILLERDWLAALSTSELGNQIRQSSPVGCVLPEEMRLNILWQCRGMKSGLTEGKWRQQMRDGVDRLANGEREYLKNIVAITEFPRGKRVLLKDIPEPYRKQFSIDTQGQAFEKIDGEPAYFPHDWENWLHRRFSL